MDIVALLEVWVKGLLDSNETTSVYYKILT